MPPPQTRRVFMFAFTASPNSDLYSSRVNQVVKESAGIELAAYEKKDTSFTQISKLSPF